MQWLINNYIRVSDTKSCFFNKITKTGRVRLGILNFSSITQRLFNQKLLKDLYVFINNFLKDLSKLTPTKSTCPRINDEPLVNQTYDNGVQFD